ncbi:MAG: chromosome segregation protein SMC [Nitrospiraceae bacterium]|nr:chromosome segregation protein SMC [Nitrospiraceae bacterium]
MRVEKIELIGFKSFAERTIVDLQGGITCVVGPNGSGKSNVVDAFKWVLGEQSAKSLRGDKMMEVVFQGSTNKKPRGMAEVSLHVSGLGGNSEDGHAVVTRRLYRSGESEYMINKTACRLKDIRDLFLDTGLELKGYSIFEQESISKIINSKPEDRRFIIEEVAGVIKYRVRRAEAENKLESSKQNLQRVNDIIGEVKKQINMLDRQARKAERYKKIMEELRELELKLAKQAFVTLSQSLSECGNELSGLREREATLRAGLSEAENEYSLGRMELAEKEKKIAALQDELQRTERELSEKERQMAVLTAEIAGLRERAATLENDEKELGQRSVAADQKVSELASEKEKISASIAGMEDAIKEKSLLVESGKEQIDAVEARLEEARKELFRIAGDLSMHNGELGKAQQALEGLKKRKESLAVEIETEKIALDQRQNDRAELENSAGLKKEQLSAAHSEMENASSRIQALKGELEAARVLIATKREALAGTVSRAESLGEMLLNPAAKEVFGQAGLNIEKGISDIFEAAPEYERAIEAGLKESAAGYIVADIDEALRAIGAMEGKGVERTAFVPLSINGNGHSIAAGGNGKTPPAGAIGRASDLVKVEPRYQGLLKALLGDMLIVKDIRDASGPQYQGWTCLSLTGETLDHRGVLTGGTDKGLLEKKRRLRELEREAEGLKGEISAAEAESERISGLLVQNEEALNTASAVARELEKEISGIAKAIEGAGADMERLSKKSSFLSAEEESTVKEIEYIGQVIAGKLELREKMEVEKSGRQQEIEEFQEELASLKESFEQKRAMLVETRMEQNALKQALGNLEKEVTGLLALKEENVQRQQQAIRQRQEALELAANKEQSSEGLMEAQRQLVRKAESFKMSLEAGRQESAESAGGLTALEERIRALRQELDSFTHSISSAEVRQAELRVRSENLISNITASYSVDLASYEAEQPAPEDEERAAGLKQKMAEMGPVSLGAIEEYEELKTRFEFMNGQKEDLEKSIAELEEAIKKINSSTRKMLRDAYDALKIKFSEMFNAFFGGGSAELVLTDENNILETGIDIVASPPGKKLQNIHLLSGGEKSLTALRLLFAGFLIKPTPLCVLDEADAALDESNVVKFSQMLKTLSRDIQFIVVTHNKMTMEVADSLFGVTMQEPGVSKMVSMRFAEAS